MIRRASALGLLALAILAVACPKQTSTSAASPVSTPAPPVTTISAGPVPSVPPGGAPTAAAAIAKLCAPPTVTTSPPPAHTTTPPQIAGVEREVEQVRGLRYLHPVAVQEITDAQIDVKLAAAFKDTYPVTYHARRSAAWRTIGVIPPGTDLRTAIKNFESGQVVGFYDPDRKRLVFVGSGDAQLSVDERFTLAHELTHALDDQHFDLRRLDSIAAACKDEDFEAALGAIEGNAQYTAAEVLLHAPEGLDLGDLIGSLLASGTRQVPGVPPFLVAIELWPYTTGLAFMQSVATAGGEAAVDRVLRHLPTTTEQVIHPGAYPSDLPARVDVPDLTPALGRAWGDLDAMQVGEQWLTAMLDLHLDDATAAAAADGWDGGVYRAWTDGTDVAVVMATAWDTPDDATGFATAMRTWIADGGAIASVHQDGSRVSVAFATDPSTLQRLGSALEA
jgi:hypothetical protein